MRLQYVGVLALSVAVGIAWPAMAEQGRGGGQGPRSQSGQSVVPPQQGAGIQLRDQDRDRMRDQDRDRVRDRDQVYGWQLMTPAERQTYRNQMRSLKTPQERDALRMQHHAEMQKRAQERGVTLPDMPVRSQGGAAVQQRTEQQVEQQQRNQQQQQQIQQQQRTQQQEQESGGHE